MLSLCKSKFRKEKIENVQIMYTEIGRWCLKNIGIGSLSVQVLCLSEREREREREERERQTERKRERENCTCGSPSLIATRMHYSAVGGDGGCRVGEVRAGTTSPIPDHEGVLGTLTARDSPTLLLSELSEIQHFKS